jgi:hypothetical protein
VVGLALAAVLLISGIAQARDSHAPPGAKDRWLPCESWVMYHWLPFNERSLYAQTGITRSEFLRYIRNDDQHSLGKLIRHKGKDPSEIVDKLMEQWDGKVTDAQMTELHRRASELMTQGHLSQHVFFHLFHDPAIALNSRWIFNVAPGDYQRARLRAYNPREIAKHGHVSVQHAVRRAMAVLRRYERQGVATKQTSRAEANKFLRIQRKNLNRWLGQNIKRSHARRFPHGTKSPRGSALKRACSFMGGPGHKMGAHDKMGM